MNHWTNKEGGEPPPEASNKGSQSKEPDKESNHSEDFDEEHKSKKDWSLYLLSIEQKAW